MVVNIDLHNSVVLKKMQERMDHTLVPGIGISVFQGDRKADLGFGVHEAGDNSRVRSDSLFHACSISKMITSICILRLVQDGVLSLNQDVNRYLTSWQVEDNLNTHNHKVTLSTLLAHQAGFIDPDGSFDIIHSDDIIPTPKELLSGTTRYCPEPTKIKYETGTQFHYSDMGYAIVELLIEDVTGESFLSVINKLVLKPLGLSKSFFWNGGSNPTVEIDTLTAGHDKFGNVVCGKRAHYPNLSGAGFWTTPSELSIVSKQLLNSLKGDTNSFLSSELTQTMTTGYGCNKGVGIGIFLSSANGEPYLFSQGWGIGYQSMLVLYPRQNGGIVVMMNSEPGKPQNESLIGEVIRGLCTELQWPGL